ncbi:LuxR C-terminal-related transcriptional regulator [Leucobacter albus]|uniref:LuxR C-terminal-related transcriptional regulator n=1 Tax=Leucobacter albus TaxID=272210 RepID=A0ABW3TL45_9MICO
MHGVFHALRATELAAATAALQLPGAVLLLTGEPGAGKHVLARQVIEQIIDQRLPADDAAGQPRVITLNASETLQHIPFGLLHTAFPAAGLPESRDLAEVYHAVLAAQQECSGGAIVLVDDADSADDESLRVIAALGGHPGFQVLITARDRNDLPGPIMRLVRDRSVSEVELAPLAFAQTKSLAAHLLGTPAIEAETLSRLHRVSGGNPLFLTELVASLKRSGSLSRFDDLVSWSGDNGEIPPSLPAFLVEELSRAHPETRSALCTVALAEPVTLATIAKLADVAAPAALDRLLTHRVIREDLAPDGTPLLRTSNQLIGDTVRGAIPAGERIQLLRSIADTLPTPLELAPAETLLRGVHVLLDAGRTPPSRALWRALGLAVASNNFGLTVRVARALSAHPGLSLTERLQATTARLQAARFSGISEFLVAPDLLTAPFTADSGFGAGPGAAFAPSFEPPFEPSFGVLPVPFEAPATSAARIDLGLARADILLYRDDDRAAARALLTSMLEAAGVAEAGAAHVSDTPAGARTHPAEPPGTSTNPAPPSPAGELSAQALAGAYIRHAYAGEFAASDALRTTAGFPRSLPRLVSVAGATILIAAQRGELKSARAIARDTLPAALGRPSEFHSAGGEIFGALCMSELLNGQVAAAARLHVALLNSLEHPTGPYRGGTGYVGTFTGMLALAEGRWGEAASEFAAAISAFGRADGMGFLAVALSGRALALASAGRTALAATVLDTLEQTQLRASRIVEGPIRLNTIAARLWIEDPTAQEAALELVEWAHQRELHLVELRAIHLASSAPARLPAAHFDRASELSARIDTPFAHTLAEATGERADGGPVQDSAAVRRLARGGIRGPFLWRAALTQREREVAGLAVLGYSTKHIAATLRVSTRTVDAHLAKAFAKLAVNDREGLALHLDRRGSLWATP